MITYNVGGRDYPLALTLGGLGSLDALCGGFEHVTAAFDGKSTMQIIDTAVKMLSILLQGGYDPLKPPSERSLLLLLMPKDVAGIRETIFQALAESMTWTVDVEPEKNAETTQVEA